MTTLPDLPWLLVWLSLFLTAYRWKPIRPGLKTVRRLVLVLELSPLVLWAVLIPLKDLAFYRRVDFRVVNRTSETFRKVSLEFVGGPSEMEDFKPGREGLFVVKPRKPTRMALILTGQDGQVHRVELQGAYDRHSFAHISAEILSNTLVAHTVDMGRPGRWWDF